MHLILTGATGLVGSSVLDAMIKTPTVTKISILSRRPIPMVDDAKDPRISVIIHKDFDTYNESVLSQLKDATGCVWALGISQNAVGKEDYIRITKSYALSFANAFQSTTDKPFNFIFVSGLGATLQPGPFASLFARVKGETELRLSSIRKTNPIFKATSVRPAFVDAAAHEAIKPYIPNPGLLMNTIGGAFSMIVRAGMKGIWSPTEPLGRFLTDAAMGKFEGMLEGRGVEILGSGMEIVENGAFRRLGGLDG